MKDFVKNTLPLDGKKGVGKNLWKIEEEMVTTNEIYFLHQE